MKKVKEFLHENARKIAIGIFIVFLVMTILSLRKSQTVIKSAEVAQPNVTLTEMKNGKVIEQSVIFDGKEEVSLISVGFRVATYNKQLEKGNITLTLKDESGRVLFENQTPVSDARDNQIIKFLLEPSIQLVGRQRITLLIVAEGLDPSDKLAIWGGEKKESEQIVPDELRVDGQVEDTTLNVSFDHIQNERKVGSLYYFGTGMIVILAIFPLLANSNEQNKRIRKHEKID